MIGGIRFFGMAIAWTALALGVAPGDAQAGPTLVVEASTGRVLHAVDPHAPWYPASLSKLMTIYVAFKAVEEGRLTFEDQVPISVAAAKEPPSKMGLKPGQSVTLRDALRMLAVKSANDIAVAVAERIGGSVAGFADEMNAHSQRLGMSASHWVNPHGLPDPGQVSSAHDMAVLARALLQEFPQHAGLFNLPSIQYGDAVHKNHNNLIGKYPGANGMKTGYICASGFNIVVSATRNGRTMIAVVLGAANSRERGEVAAAILEEGFEEPWFSLNPRKLDAMPRPAGLSMTPFDMKPFVCGARRAEEGVAELMFDRSIDVERGRLILARGAGMIDEPKRSPAEVAVSTLVATSVVIDGEEVPLPRPRPGTNTASAQVPEALRGGLSVSPRSAYR